MCLSNKVGGVLLTGELLKLKLFRERKCKRIYIWRLLIGSTVFVPNVLCESHGKMMEVIIDEEVYLEQLVEEEDDEAGNDKLDNDEKADSGTDLSRISVESRHDVHDGLAHGDDHSEDCK